MSSAHCSVGLGYCSFPVLGESVLESVSSPGRSSSAGIFDEEM